MSHSVRGHFAWLESGWLGVVLALCMRPHVEAQHHLAIVRALAHIHHPHTLLTLLFLIALVYQHVRAGEALLNVATSEHSAGLLAVHASFMPLWTVLMQHDSARVRKHAAIVFIELASHHAEYVTLVQQSSSTHTWPLSLTHCMPSRVQCCNAEGHGRPCRTARRARQQWTSCERTSSSSIAP